MPLTGSPLPIDAAARRWRLGIEAGGTFTDCLALAPDGTPRRAKVLSSGVLRLNAQPRDHGAWLLEPEGAACGWNLEGFSARVGDDPNLRRVVAHDGDRIEVEPRSPSPRGRAVIAFSTGEPASVLAARLATATPAGVPLPAALVRLATTRATNALLQHRLSPTLLLVTRGFADLLFIGDQRRPDLFALDVRRAPLPYTAVVEVDERLDEAGNVVKALDAQAALHAARAHLHSGCRAAAVAFMHAWRNPVHEEAMAQVLIQAGFEHVSTSAGLSPRIKYVPRARTAVLNAALSGAIAGFIAETRAGWRDASARIEVMTSAGGLVDALAFAPKDSLLSGPAGGAAGAAAIGRRAGVARVIAFDMGGTSTDITRIDDVPEIATSHRVGGFELLAPALAVHSVAAGGGSICTLALVPTSAREGAVACPRVGPHSAGAEPGPACFGNGGPLTITDANVLLGRLDPHDFESPICADAGRRALAAMRSAAAAARAPLPPDETLLEGFVTLADERMAQAIRAISVRKGYDPREYALLAFGGAGGQHACAVASALGIERVILPADASILCAAGLHAAAVQCVEESQVLASLTAASPDLVDRFASTEGRAARAFARAGAGERPAEVRRTLRARVAGQDHALDIDWSPGLDVAEAFARLASRVYGYPLEGREIEIESIRVTLNGQRPALPREITRDEPAPCASPAGATRRVFLDGAWQPARMVDASDPLWNEPVTGPALIRARWTTLLLRSGWKAERLPSGDVLARVTAPRREGAALAGCTLEVAPTCTPAAHTELRDALIAGRLEALAEAMGELLGRVALSTNVKERLDYSCALLDPRGRLVISAPHIPVHLGALGVCVRRVIETLPLARGEVAITNHPGFGGSHLPDITLVAPAHADDDRLLGYAACRAHHADVGGTRPGSMPPDARALDEEGVVIAPVVLARGESVDWQAIESRLRAGRFPARVPLDNLADLAAQLAAIRMGTRGLRDAARAVGTPAIASGMSSILDRSAHHASAAIARLGSFDRTARRAMDDGATIHVRASMRAGPDQAPMLHLDFTGSGPVHRGNLNAPLGVIHSAVMYVIRLLVGRDSRDADHVPLCDGLMVPVSMHLPEGMLNPPWNKLGNDPGSLPAVAGGNVETSQQVVNALLDALDLAADSQGTMNNLLFGDTARSHYETLGGGTGAGPGFAGAHAVHSHMTNTAITDPEILERRFPVRLNRFAIRPGSGGAGANPGGHGLIRDLTFLEPMAVSLLGTNRSPTQGPHGHAGGSNGAPASQVLIRRSGERVAISHAAAIDASPGDRLIIETPGGGGWGRAGGAHQSLGP